MPTNNTPYDFRSAGYNQFMKRRVSGATTIEQQTGDESSYQIRHLSGTSISSGVSKSSDGKMTINWDKAQFVATDGARNRVEIGKIEGTESYGIRIYDADGTLIMSALGKVQNEGIEGISADKITTGTLAATTKITVGTSILIGNPN